MLIVLRFTSIRKFSSICYWKAYASLPTSYFTTAHLLRLLLNLLLISVQIRGSDRTKLFLKNGVCKYALKHSQIHLTLRLHNDIKNCVVCEINCTKWQQNHLFLLIFSCLH